MPRSRHAQTLAHTVTLSGHGVHSNRPCTVTLHPADQATGILFRHLPSGVTVPALAAFVGDCSLATTLVREGVILQTVEHLLSALAGLGIDHLTVDVTGEELPILDGSAAPWVQAIQAAGIRSMPMGSQCLRILHPVEVRRGDKWMRVTPYPGLRVGYTIDFDHPAIGRQSRELTITPEKYVRELGSARTFCLEQDIEFMRAWPRAAAWTTPWCSAPTAPSTIPFGSRTRRCGTRSWTCWGTSSSWARPWKAWWRPIGPAMRCMWNWPGPSWPTKTPGPWSNPWRCGPVRTPSATGSAFRAPFPRSQIYRVAVGP